MVKHELVIPLLLLFGQLCLAAILSRTIDTVAGGGQFHTDGDGLPAIHACIQNPMAMDVTEMDDLIVSEATRNRIRIISKGIIRTFAGYGGPRGYSGDGGPATSADMSFPMGLSYENGTLVICDTVNLRIRKIFPNGTIVTICGTGVAGYSGDGGPATLSTINYPGGLTLKNGEVFIADTDNNVVRKIMKNGTITTVAGSGVNGYQGDGGLAVQARLSNVYEVGFQNENLIIGDLVNNMVLRRVFPNGTIGTFISDPIFAHHIFTDRNSNMFVTNRTSIVKITPNGVVTRVAGRDDLLGYGGDNGPATNATMNEVRGSAVNSLGELFVSDYYNNRVRKVDSNGIISTVAGNCQRNYFVGEGVDAKTANLNNPTSVQVLTDGSFIVMDSGNYLLRKVNGGIITSVAGNGGKGNQTAFNGEGATSLSMDDSFGAVVTSNNGILIAENGRIIQVDSTGKISTLISAKNVSSIFSDRDGTIYYVDTLHFLYKIIGNSVTKLAGNGICGYSTSTVLANTSSICAPQKLFVHNGEIFFSEPLNHLIRKIDTSGQISIVAGNSTCAFSSDGNPSTSSICSPKGLFITYDGTVYFTDGRSMVRKISQGMLWTVAGNASVGFGGDGGNALGAQLSDPTDVFVNSDGSIWITDSGNGRVRKVSVNCQEGYVGPACDISYCYPVVMSNGSVSCVNVGGQSETVQITANYFEELNSKQITFTKYESVKADLPSNIGNYLSNRSGSSNGSVTVVATVSTAIDGSFIVTPLVSMQFFNTTSGIPISVQQLDRSIVFTFYNVTLSGTQQNFTCSYFNQTTNTWKTDGVQTLQTTANQQSVTIQCLSNHLTSFAIIDDNIRKSTVQNAAPDNSATIIAIVVSVVGACIIFSVVALIISVSVLLLTRKKKRDRSMSRRN